MIRSFKLLATALVVLGVFAPLAKAEPPMFHIEESPLTLEGKYVSGSQFNLGGNAVTCAKTSLGGEISETTTTLTLIPVFSECQAFGFVSATVNPHSCHITLHLTANPKPTGTEEISCTKAGEKIEITAGTCTATIGEQAGREHVLLTNGTVGSTMEMLLEFTVEGITYSVTKDGFLCPFSGTGAFSNGKSEWIATVPHVTVF